VPPSWPPPLSAPLMRIAQTPRQRRVVASTKGMPFTCRLQRRHR